MLHENDALLPHEPDHVIALKHEGQTHENNLAWACFLCNRFKGSDIASVDIETGRIARLFNPRLDEWTAHFRLQDALIVALTAEGRVTEHLLQLNRPDRLSRRQLLLGLGQYPRS
ncbi:MAG TPA: HNH endonuclease [Gemmataceae bacterium]|nr:HNH endonuclease [Gemmataceae bacterium]